MRRMPWRWQGEERYRDVPSRGALMSPAKALGQAGLLKVGTEEDGTGRRWG